MNMPGRQITLYTKLKIRDITRAVLIFACLFWAIGCGGGSGGGSGGSSGSSSGNDTGSTSWSHPTDHQTAFLSDPDSCRVCHGTDLRGGDAGVSCFSSSYAGTSCHTGGTTPHPAGWADPDEHGSTAKAAPDIAHGFSYCQNCHGQEFSGGIFNASCFTCHGVNAPHSPYPWRGGARTHVNTHVNNAAVCAACHTNGANSTLKPSPFAAGANPGCFNNTLCHSDTFNCSACHAYPPATGKHAVHTALDHVDCSTCHSGAGAGTLNHFNGSVEVTFASAFNSKSGAASFNPVSKTCSNISCHGGPRTQTSAQAKANPPVSDPAQTPDWLNGIIDADTECTACHVYGTDTSAPEYNIYHSGFHKFHVFEIFSGQGIECTECHDPGALSQSHFTNLHTPEVSSDADAFYQDLNYAGWTTGDCTTGCHSW